MRIGIVFLVTVVATTVRHVAEAIEIHVGGDGGWLRPSSPDFYSLWAAGLNFTVGDVLVFSFQTGAHNVAGVTKDGYDNCNTSNPKFLNTTSPFSFTLETLDDFYFICTVPGHCSAGQKLAITNVQQSPPPGSSPPDSPPVSGEMPPPVVTAPPPPNSVTRTMASIFTVALVSIAVTLIIY
ncbi:umecyanin-like [Benincasa hispida]|uniref:umecyanin-like n=1 Tax=Benincasa hispida TaxID=102211 RepID=UPI001900BB78|nr:umecyanin-like [Benincasa hispida]